MSLFSGIISLVLHSQTSPICQLTLPNDDAPSIFGWHLLTPIIKNFQLYCALSMSMTTSISRLRYFDDAQVSDILQFESERQLTLFICIYLDDISMKPLEESVSTHSFHRRLTKKNEARVRHLHCSDQKAEWCLHCEHSILSILFCLKLWIYDEQF